MACTETGCYGAPRSYKFARADIGPILNQMGTTVPGNTSRPRNTHHHRFRGRLVPPDVYTAAKAIGLLAGVAMLAILTALIVAGTTIGLALLLIR